MASSQPQIPNRELEELLRKAALQLVLVQPDDASSLERLRQSVSALCAALSDDPVRVALAKQALAALAGDADALSGIEGGLARASLALEELGLGFGEHEATPASPEKASEAAAANRDADTIELFGGFLSESEEGLERVDVILLAAEQANAGAEQIDALFRVFHTIKGVSGFLGTSEVTRLAHASETLLDQVRKGKRQLTGDTLELCLEASAVMRVLLADVRQAVDTDRAVLGYPPAVELVDRLTQATTPAVDLGAGTPSVIPASLRSRAAPLEPRVSAMPEPESQVQLSMDPGKPSRIPTSGRVSAVPARLSLRPRRSRKPLAIADANRRIPDTVKVDIERVDSVVEMIGELLIVESMIVNAPELLRFSSPRVRTYLGQLNKITRDLQNVAMRMRMVPVRGVFHKMARLVHDLSRKTGKRVQLLQSGEMTEVDRSIVERIEDPLVHMMRNALDHAIEGPEERKGSGKPEVGTLHLSAAHEAGCIAIELSDDGRGLNRERILRKATQQGLLADGGQNLSDADVYGLIFRPGFSTAEAVSELSGRGVGMDVVKRSVESMRGRVTVSSKPGQGTSFRLLLPLTLAIIEGMLVSCAGQRYIVPSLSIVESLRPTPQMVRRAGASDEIVNVRGQMFPLLRLNRCFGVVGAELPPDQAIVVIVESGGRKLGLLVDDVLTQQQVVIKPLSEALGDTEFFAGAAILSDGRVGLIINVDRLGRLLSARRQKLGDPREVAIVT